MGIFTDLQTEQENQKKQLEAGTEVVLPAQEDKPEPAHEHTHATAVKNTHESTQIFEQPLKLPQTLPTTDIVETLTFNTRRDAKVKVNTEVPLSWKVKLDEIAYQLKVGKYELLAYIIGEFLDEI